MWQRVQTIFLLLVAISMFLMFFFPLWEKVPPEENVLHRITAFYYEVISEQQDVAERVYFPYTLIGVLAGLAIGIALFEITMFKNRLTQMKLGAFNSLVMAGSLGLTVYYTIQLDEQIYPTFEPTYGIGFYMPAAAMIFNIMANRFIRRDEKLVRSTDRIR